MVLGVGKGVLLREVSSVDKLPRRVIHRTYTLYVYVSEVECTRVALGVRKGRCPGVRIEREWLRCMHTLPFLTSLPLWHVPHIPEMTRNVQVLKLSHSYIHQHYTYTTSSLTDTVSPALPLLRAFHPVCARAIRRGFRTSVLFIYSSSVHTHAHRHTHNNYALFTHTCTQTHT